VTGYAEVEPDVATAFAKLGPMDVNRRWAEWFEEIIVRLTDDDGNLFRADEVWHLD
jgi:L-rhamnose mutarotase